WLPPGFALHRRVALGPRRLDDRGKLAQNLLHALAAHRGEDERLPFRSLGERLRLALELVGGNGVAFRQRHDLRLVLEPGAIGCELAADDAIGLCRIVERRVDEMQEHRAALDMTEETVADA